MQAVVIVTPLRMRQIHWKDLLLLFLSVAFFPLLQKSAL